MELVGACDPAEAVRVRHKLPKPMCFQSVSIKRLCWRNRLMGSGTMIFFLTFVAYIY